MLSKRFSHLIRLFAIISFSYLSVSCGDGDGPTPVVAESCPANGVVSFDSDSYPASATLAVITVTDACIGRKTVVVNVDNGTDTIAVDLDVADGEGASPIKFGDTDDASNTIAIKEGDVLTVKYADANTVERTDTSDIAASTALSTLGVYSETNTNPELEYAEILGMSAVTDRFSQTVTALEGNFSLQADFALPSSGNENGFAFTFFGLVNPNFEADDALLGSVDCFEGFLPNGCTGWSAFEFVNTINTAGPNFGPVSHDVGGAQSLGMYGPFSFDSSSGAYQADDTVVAGQSYTATAYAMNWDGDNLGATNLGIMQLSFWSAAGGQDGGGTQIGPAFEIKVDSTDDGIDTYLPPQDGADISDWTELTITETAPAGAVSAEIFLLHIQLGNTAAEQEGSIYWDDVSLTGVKDLSGTGEDISTYETLKFGINTTEASGLMDLEIKMEDNTGATASAFLSNYTRLVVGDWALVEIPLSDFVGIDKTRMIALGFENASSTITGSTTVAPTLLAATLYFDDVHFAKADTALTGVLLDSPVEGVTFETATQSGITNVDGEFLYLDGEMITFSVGDIVLGTVPGAPVITSVELTGSADPTVQAATNQLVFLQSIDADENPLNGITISAATQAAAVGQILDFTLDSAAFTTAATIVVNDITEPDNAVLSETTALDNFYLTYVDLGGTDTFSWLFPGYPAVPAVASGTTTTIDAVPDSVVADGLSSSTITVQAKDSSGFDITLSAGTVSLSSLSGTAVIGPVSDIGNGTYTATVSNTVAENVTINGTIDGKTITDNAMVTFTPSNVPETLGVYSESNTPVLDSVIINAAGGNTIIPNEVSTGVEPLDGSVVLQTLFLNSSETFGGVIFDFGQVTSGGGNLLLNGGFDSPEASTGDVSCHTDWTCVGQSYTTAADGPNFAPVSHNPEDNQSVKQFGNDGLTFQDVTATVGETYEASVWVMNWTGNGITDPFGEFAFMELSFRDGAGDLISGSDSQVFVDPIDDGTNIYLAPQDGADVSDWTQLKISAVAPAGAVSARILLLHQIVGGSGGTIRWDDASITAVGNLLTNGGFDSPEASTGDVSCHTDWTCVGQSYTTAADGPNFAPVSHNPEDNQSVKQFGNDGLTFQDVTATVGETYEASVWVMNWTGNGITDPFGEFAFMELSFRDGAGNLISGSDSQVFVDPIDDGTNIYLAPQDGADVSDWTQLKISAVAPAGAVSARILLLHQIVGGSGGAIRWDDASITTSGSTVSGVDLSDYETLTFGIDSSVMSGFSDLKLQLEDSTVSPSVFLSGYSSTPNQGAGSNWEIYEIPLSDFTGLNTSNLINLGFWDAQDSVGDLTFGPLYFDDIHFVKEIPTIPVLTGVLLDSPVEGVAFTTATQSGITSALGEFQYQAGEMVTFSVGDIVLGVVQGADIITPVELTGSFDPTNQTAINLLVFLQSIDEDENHANGITISAATQAAAVGQTLDFSLDSAAFTTAVTTVVNNITEPDNAVVSETTALDNFYLTYVDLGGTNTFSWLFPGYPQVGESGYDLIWSDEFNVGTSPDANNWTIETGYGDNGWGNNEWQLYTTSPDNVKLESGNLVITADCPTFPTCGVRNGTVTSGKINTLNKFEFKYGKVQARIKPAVGTGAWPAFWMLGANFPDVGWPFSGEIDVMEMHNFFSNEFTTHFTMHWCEDSLQTSPTCLPEGSGWTYDSQFSTFAESLGNDFHIFEAEWNSGQMIGKIDGITYYTRTIDPANMDEFLKEFYLILNVAMGGTLGSNENPPTGLETWPQTMLVDYVRVYQLIGGDGTYTMGGGGSPGPNLLLNGGFDSPEASTGDVSCHTDWTCVGQSYTTAADGPNFAPVSHNPEDNQSVKQFGNDGLTFQDVTATVGETYEASVWVMNWTGNGITDPFGEFAFMELSFRDGAGNLISGSDSQVFVDPIDDGTNIYLAPQDGADVSDWTQLKISAVAPAGAVSARILLLHQIVGGSGGTIRWDDASLSVTN